MGAFVNQIRKKLGLEPKRDKTLVGSVPNEVIINRSMNEASDLNPVVFAPARMNPPTAAHRLIINAAKQAAEEHNAPHHIILTRSHDVVKKKRGAGIRNPLTPEQKLKHARRFFPDANVQLADKDKPNLLSQLSDLHKRGHGHVIMVAGSDRIPEYKRLIDSYNGKSGPHGYFNFKKVSFRSAGERDPDAEGPAGWSATKSRQTAEAGDYDTFKRNAVPEHIKDEHTQELYHDLRGGMGINEDVGFNMAGAGIPAVPTRSARDIQGKKSPLTNTPPPGKKGNIGYDSDLDDGTEKSKVNLARRRAQKRYFATQAFEGVDSIGGDLDQSPTVWPATTTPVPSTRPKLKSFKKVVGEGMFADINVPGESGSPNYGSDVTTGSDSTMIRSTKKDRKLKEDKPCWKNYEMVGMKKGKGGKPVPNCVPVKEESDEAALERLKKNKSREKWHADVELDEATYQGKTVPLNKPMAGDVKKSKVYVDPDGDGKAKKVNFGDKNLSIKKNIPARKKSYCARSSGQGNLTDKSSANYWSRKAWNCEEVELDEVSQNTLAAYRRANEKDYVTNRDPSRQEKRRRGFTVSTHKMLATKGVKVPAVESADLNRNGIDDDEEKDFRGDLLKRGTRVIVKKPGYDNLKGNIDSYDRENKNYVVSIDHNGSNMIASKHEVEPINEFKNKPYVKPHYGDPSNQTRQTGWKASNKHGKVKYFGMDFRTSAKRHAGLLSESLIEQVMSIMGTEE